MFQLVYTSTETDPFSGPDLVRLLKKSRHNNEKLGITGMLLYHNGSFLQALEGVESSVRRLADRIAVDPRHTGVVTLYTATVEKPDFPDWSMGFHNLGAIGVPEIKGYSRFLESPLSAEHFAANPAMAKKLLLEFKSNLKRVPPLAKGAPAE
jgi:hypothetical protein